jgi:AraC-like DNA-binding protein
MGNMHQPAVAEGGAHGTTFETIHGHMLHQFSVIVSELRGNADGLLRQVGIIPATGPHDRIRASYRQFVALLELAAAKLDCPDFGMQLAARQARNAFAGSLGAGMRNSRNFGDALSFVCNHSYAHSLAAWIWRRPSRSGENTVVGHDILLEGLPQQSQAMEYVLLVGNLGTIDLTEGRVRARRVIFRHQPVSPLRIYRRNFGCDVRFGRGADAVVYSNHDLDCPINDPDARAYQTAAQTIEARFARHRPPLHADIRGNIAHVLGTEFCTKEHIAATLGLHSRTMARRLAAEGTSFQEIKDQVRRDRMLYYVQQTDLDFTEISERLGFSEQAVMTRCCRKWFAMSPTALRATLRGRDHSPAGASNFVSIGQFDAA